MTEEARKWTQRYCPTPADQIPADQATAYEMRFWRGLDQLPAYGLEKRGCDTIVDFEANPVISIDAGTCAYCQLYLNTRSKAQNRCADCPITRTLGYPCDSMPYAPYVYWQETGDPGLMLRVLDAIECREREGRESYCGPTQHRQNPYGERGGKQQ